MTIHGITDPARSTARVPTVSVSIDGVTPRAAAEALARDGIYAWDGDFYATGLIERLGKTEVGGVLRLGLVHYNTAAEVDRTLERRSRRIAGRSWASGRRSGGAWPARSTRPSCDGSSGSGSVTRSPRTPATSTG